MRSVRHTASPKRDRPSIEVLVSTTSRRIPVTRITQYWIADESSGRGPIGTRDVRGAYHAEATTPGYSDIDAAAVEAGASTEEAARVSVTMVNRTDGSRAFAGGAFGLLFAARLPRGHSRHAAAGGSRAERLAGVVPHRPVPGDPGTAGAVALDHLSGCVSAARARPSLMGEHLSGPTALDARAERSRTRYQARMPAVGITQGVRGN